MARNIAVMLGEDGFNAALGDPGTVVVYRRAQGAWDVDRQMPFSVDPAAGLRGLRERMSQLLEFLGDCRAFVARSAGGALYYELEKAGCSVWEINGKPADYLDEVWTEEIEEQYAAPQSTPAKMPVPREVTPGRFFISLKEVQGRAPEVSSKQVLQAFVRRRGFDVLEIACDHVPPWIEMEAAGGGLAMESERLGDHEVRVRLLKKQTSNA